VERKFNWFGLAGGTATILLIVVSLFVPWWTFQIGSSSTGGSPLLVANVSPLNTNFGGLGDSFTVPLIWALNLASVLTMLAGGIIMLIYSVLPAKPYSMKLLSFSYRKPLYSVIFFAISLVALSLIVQSLIGVSIPINGSAVVQFPQSMSPGATVSVLVTANLLWPFWFSIAPAALCIAARFYHKKVAMIPAAAVIPPSLLTNAKIPIQQSENPK
jgi:hypothetical protein